MKRLLAWRVLVGVLVLVLLAVVACAKASPTPTPKLTPTPTPTASPTPAPTWTPTPAGMDRYGGVLTVVGHASLAILDPMKGPIITGNISNHTHEGLFALDADFMPQPELVDEWQVSGAGMRWTFKLREGIKFHNGEPLTSRAAAGSWKRWSEFWSFGKLVGTFVDTVEEIDDLTFTITLKEPSGLLLDGFVMFKVLPESQIDVPISEGLTEVIGTGPYKFKKWNPGDRYVMERWDGYKDQVQTAPASFLVGRKAAYLDEIVWLEIPDIATRVAALETGEVDFLDDFKPEFARRVDENPDPTLYVIKPGAPPLIIMNNVVPPFNDVRARQAVRMAYPYEDAMIAAVGDPDLWDLCPSYFVCGSRWESDAAEDLYNQRDIEGARKLLEEAELVGTKVRLMVGQDVPIIPEVGLVTREILEDLGFDVEFQSLDWATVASNRTHPDMWEAFITYGGRDWSFNSPLSNVAASPGGYWNDYQDESGETARLMAEFARVTTYEEQMKIMDEWTRVFWEDVPSLPTGVFYRVMAKGKQVKGSEAYPDPIFHNVWLER